jgi:CubicO group peptidase (beta-lactamase class C family)
MRTSPASTERVRRQYLHWILTAFCVSLLTLSIGLPSFQIEGRVEAGSVQEQVFPGESWVRIQKPESVGYSSDGLKEVEEYAKTLNTTGLMVVVGGRVLFEYGDIEQLSYLASVRKSILAMLYGNYVAEGTIDLKKTLSDLEMTDHGGLLPIEVEATVEHLITARSGIYHPASNSGDNLADAPPRGSQKPGGYFLYNNWDFNAAGAAFEIMTGRNIYDALETDLAQPINMQDFDRSRHRKSGNLNRSMYPAYHMHLSTRDMARVGYLMLREGNWAGRQIIPRDWAHKIVSVVTPLEEMNPERMRNDSFGYGYMWWVWDGPDATGPLKGAYTGKGAYGQYITVLPALDMVIVHKTAVPPQKRTNWGQYEGIIERIIAARIEDNEMP